MNNECVRDPRNLQIPARVPLVGAVSNRTGSTIRVLVISESRHSASLELP